MQERRKFRRITAKIMVIYKVMGIKGETILESIDLGGGGVRLMVKGKMPKGAQVELGLTIPPSKDVYFVLGKIAWQSDVPRLVTGVGHRFETGIEFIRMDIAQKIKLMRFVRDRLRELKNEKK